MLGACAGMCYNALWYFPVLIALGGIVTATWDVSLRQQVLRLRRRMKQRRRPLDESSEDSDGQGITVVSADLSAPQATAVNLQRRTGSAVTSMTEASQSEAPTRGGPFTADEAPSTSTDMGSHGIPVWAGLGIIGTFFGMLKWSVSKVQSLILSQSPSSSSL